MFSTFHLPAARFAEVSLETLAQNDEKQFGIPQKSRLLDPTYCQRLLDAEHARLGVTHSHGDYLASRRSTWRGHYQEKDQKFVHLGLDITVPEGTPVLAPFPCIVERLDSDLDQDGGWGARAFLNPIGAKPLPYLLLAHLSDDFLIKERDLIPKGTALGFIAGPATNGGWFPHLHVQAIARRDWPDVYTNLKHLDGYCRADQVPALKEVFPNPLPCLLAKQKS